MVDKIDRMTKAIDNAERRLASLRKRARNALDTAANCLYDIEQSMVTVEAHCYYERDGRTKRKHMTLEQFCDMQWKGLTEYGGDFCISLKGDRGYRSDEDENPMCEFCGICDYGDGGNPHLSQCPKATP